MSRKKRTSNPYEFDRREAEKLKNKPVKYRIQNLATVGNDGKISFPFSPGFSLKYIADNLAGTPAGLVRVHFREEFRNLFQYFESGEGYTGMDTLVMTLRFKNGYASFMHAGERIIASILVQEDGTSDNVEWWIKEEDEKRPLFWVLNTEQMKKILIEANKIRFA